MFSRRPAIALLALLVVLSVPDIPLAETPDNGKIDLAQLELNFQFGLDDGAVARLLGRQGFTDIEIQNRKITRTRVHACRNGDLYRIDIRPSGQIARQNRIGRCGPEFTVDEARNVLSGAGFTEVVLEPVQNGFQGTACRDGTRSAVFVAGPGDIRQLGVVGNCWRQVTRQEVRKILRGEGYRDIEFQDYPPPPFIVAACKGRKRLEVLVAADGRIWREQQIGRCQPPLSAEALTAKLGNEGYSRIEIKRSTTNGHRLEACDGDKRVKLRLSPSGEILRKDVTDFCAPARLDEVLIDMDKRGFGRTAFFAEVCERGRKIRIGLDQYGSQRSRQDIGTCR